MESELPPCIIMPCGTIVYKVYSFQFEHEGQTVHVAFMHYGEYNQAYDRSGADHSFSHELRRSFARMLLNEPAPRLANSWIPIPEHEYLSKLKENGFEYGTYNICKIRSANRIHVTIRTAQDGPQLIFSPHFSR